jgi:hypothetical protein
VGGGGQHSLQGSLCQWQDEEKSQQDSSHILDDNKCLPILLIDLCVVVIKLMVIFETPLCQASFTVLLLEIYRQF